MKSSLKNESSSFSFEEFRKFNSELKEILKQISCLSFSINKEKVKESEIENLLKLNKENELIYEYLFFINHNIWINIYIDFHIFNDNITFFEKLKRLRIYNDKNIFNNNMLKCIYHMYLYFILSMEKSIKLLVPRDNNELMVEKRIKVINQSYHLIFHIFVLITKLYNENIYNLKQLLLFLDGLLYFINKNEFINDKYLKIKNKILFELLFDFYGKVSIIILKGNRNEKDILYFFNYLKTNFRNKIFKTNFNTSILTNYQIIQKFMSLLLNNFNFTISLHEDIYKSCKTEIIDSFAAVYDNNLSKFFSMLINQNKKSFVNLYNFKKNKECIIKDIYLYNFYIELLNKLLEKEKNNFNKDNANIISPINFFVYNGYNSKMTFKLKDIDLENSIMFFSFQLDNNIDKKNTNLPLLIIEKEFNLFKLYIKQIYQKELNKTNYKLYLCQEKSKGIMNKELDQIDDIIPNTNYFIALNFMKTKLCINILSTINKNEKNYHQEININSIKNIIYNLKLGHNNEKQEYFKGYIGPFIIIKNFSLNKGTNNEEIITNILKLNNYYKFFPYFICKNANYNFDNIFSYYQIDTENLFNKIKTFLENNISEFDCLFYITPEIMNVYNSLMGKSFICLPDIPDIYQSEKNHLIVDLNISLTNYNSTYIDFLRNNGFDYICLIFEYFYQFSNMYNLYKNDFSFGSFGQKLNEKITSILIETLTLLHQYNYCLYIEKFISKFKRMYKNLYECLISLNNIWNIITEDLLLKLYDLVFSLKELTNKRQNNNLVNSNLSSAISFTDGLIDILFNIDLFKKYDTVNLEEILFSLISSFLYSFIINKKQNNYLPIKIDFFWKIINFTTILKEKFTNDYNNKNKTISSFFNLLDNYFICFKDDKNSLFYFKELLQFSLGNFQNNLIITYNFLCFIHEMICKGYILEDYEILLLIEFSKKYYKNDNDNTQEKKDIKLTNEMFSIISCILIDLFFYNDSTVITDEINKEIKKYSDNNIIMSKVMNELRVIIEGLIDNNSSFIIKDIVKLYKVKYKTNYMKLYWKIFYFIIIIFKNNITEDDINNEIENDDEDQEKKNIDKLKKNVNIMNLYTLLVNIEELLRGTKEKKLDNTQTVYCLINFIKFYHYIIFNEKNILKLLDIQFIDNLLQLINLCSKFNPIINANHLFQVKIGDSEYNKTIIEMIFEIYIHYFLSDINSIICYNHLLSSKYIFYDNDISKDKTHTIFYTNDYFRYLLFNKKINEKENTIVHKKYKILCNYNDNIFKTEEIFDLNFTTFFLLKIGGYLQNLDNLKNINISPINELKKNINELFSLILEEHLNLSDLNNNYFFKNINSSNTQYNELIKLIKNKYLKKKKIPLDEIKKFFENNINTISDQVLHTDNKNPYLNIFYLDENNKKGNKENDEIIINQIAFPKDINRITYFDDLDKSFLKNPKKKIMNNIFSIYYLDIFYYNRTFCRMRDYFINKILDNSIAGIKQLDFPSKIKNFRNNLEPPLFIKEYKDYFNNPIFPISHQYINEQNNHLIDDYETIKLLSKQFPIYEQEMKIKFECEIIKADECYYGNLIIKDSPDCFLFQEEDIDLEKYNNGYKYMFLITYFSENEKSKSKKKNDYIKFQVKRDKKNLLIIFDEIEEILEIRELLLWKALEIYLKNGKSYIFNFLDTKEFEKIMNILKNKNNIKDLIRNKNFFNKKNIPNYWKRGLINNYEYILLLNKYGSRSFNDPNQYPIFPWLLINYKYIDFFNEKEKEYEEYLVNYINNKKDEYENNNIDNNNNHFLVSDKLLKESKDIIRKFEYPPSLQSKKKREAAICKYADDEENGEFPIHSGCHYSTSSYIYFYLMRQQPFCDLLIKLQAYSLENTNRCFGSILLTESVIMNGNDNRELIPELFSKIEYFLNLNCDYYGYFNKYQGILDDVIIDIFQTNEKGKSNRYPLSNYVRFILEHKRLLNAKIIGYYLNKWIDNIFGINQFPPEKLRKNSCNIFNKFTYEQKVNLENKLEKNINKNKLNEKQIKEKINLVINCIFNFGQTPYQIFNEAHHKLNIRVKKEIIQKPNKLELNDLEEEEDNEFEHDLESCIKSYFRNHNLFKTIDEKPLYFQINSSIDKILVYNNIGNIIILDCELFNKKDSSFYCLLEKIKIEKSNIILYGIMNNNNNYLLYKLKYAFSSFDVKLPMNYNLNISESFHTFYTEMINEINDGNTINNEIKESKKTKTENKIYLIMTSRHMDFTFKIYLILMLNNNKKKGAISKYFSFICEDFVTSCCTSSNNHFIIGLKNGKLISYSINLINNINDDKNNKNTKSKNEKDYLDGIKVKIKMESYIQGHQSKINMIEIDKRLGIIITSGDDNYLFIRKLYDFELLLPIKIKLKYIVLMAKISSFNFLYVLCYNKIKEKTVIFGYTLAGLKFAKSDYGLYDNINFTKNGNLVCIDNNKEEVIVFSGSDLSRININENENEETIKVINEIKKTKWMQFDWFLRTFEDDITKIVTYFSFNGNNNKNEIKTLDVKNIKFFD